MYLVGLTGGIAAGKSTVAQVWESLGAKVIDADVLARKALEPDSEGFVAVVKRFGTEVLSSDGNINRGFLASKVFSDEVARRDLEQIVHPQVQRLANAEFELLSDDSIAVYVVPLLVEAKVSLPFDVVVTVEAPLETQVSRMIETRGMTEAEAKLRISAQATSAQRANVAEFILSSNQSLDLLARDATALWREISQLANRKREQRA